MQILLPKGWPRPKGYSNGIVAKGRTLFVAGQVAWNEQEQVVSDNFTDQVRQVLLNIVAILNEGGAKPEHITRMTWYVTDKEEYLSALRSLGKVYQEVIGKHYPTMTLVEISGLVEEGAKVEIETTAVVPG